MRASRASERERTEEDEDGSFLVPVARRFLRDLKGAVRGRRILERPLDDRVVEEPGEVTLRGPALATVLALRGPALAAVMAAFVAAVVAFRWERFVFAPGLVVAGRSTALRRGSRRGSNNEDLACA